MPSANGPRRRQVASPPPKSPPSPAVKQINAAPSLEKAKLDYDTDGGYAWARVAATVGVTLQATLPAMLSWGMTMGLIFGGCCSNVFALEKIVKEEPQSGLLITFVQFLLTAAFTYPTHFSLTHRPFLLKPRAVPLVRWLPNIIIFFTVNILNNFAFSYDISVPVHIILRSGGSVTTMLVGFIWGKRYTRMQVFSVAMLTLGIIIAAMADARSKGRSTSLASSTSSTSFLTGFFILLFAQILSAVMGLYTQLTYAAYGTHWHENLFYSHFLSLPLFIPFMPALLGQFRQFLKSPPLQVPPSFLSLSLSAPSFNKAYTTQPHFPPLPLLPSFSFPTIPKHVVFLAMNALTQYACIRGVNLLGARTSALGVTIVLNVRKLVSLFASIWLFGNHLPLGVVLGAAVVFGSAGVWAWEGQRIGRRKG